MGAVQECDAVGGGEAETSRPVTLTMAFTRVLPTGEQLLQLRLQAVPFAVLPLDELLGLGRIFRFHRRAVPLDLLAGAQGDAAEQHDFGQVRRDIEIRVRRDLAAFARGDPFEMLPGVRRAFVDVTRFALGNRLNGLMHIVAHEFLIPLELAKEGQVLIAIFL